MTLKEREDLFITKCKKDFGTLSFETEHLLRYGFLSGAQELSETAYVEGINAQQTTVLEALGAAPTANKANRP